MNHAVDGKGEAKSGGGGWREAECNSDNTAFSTHDGGRVLVFTRSLCAAALLSGACSVEDEDCVALLRLSKRSEPPL